MNLLVLMYHCPLNRAGRITAETLDAHFRHIARHLHCVLPGDALEAKTLNVCLSFDDGACDFFSLVFPLLRKYGLRAMLAVAPALVRESRERARPARRRDRGGADGFSTWPELREMVRSGHVAVAAHGCTHCRLDAPDVDLDTEIALPQALLGVRLGCPVDSFVFPEGRFSRAALARARALYRYVFRIGAAANAGWHDGLLYRIDAVDGDAPTDLFRRSRLLGYTARHFWNRVRGR